LLFSVSFTVAFFFHQAVSFFFLQDLLKKLHAIRLASKIAPVCDGVKKVLVKSAQSSQHVANQFDPLFWWFHSIRLKFGKIHIVLPSGKLMFLFTLLFSAVYVLRRKTAGLKR